MVVTFCSRRLGFGIAKATAGRLTDQTLFTAFEKFIGTPASQQLGIPAIV